MLRPLAVLLALHVAQPVAAQLPQAPAADRTLQRQSQARIEPFLAELGSLVAIDSGSDRPQGLDRMATHLEQRLQGLGARVERHPARPAAGDTLVARLEGRGDRGILLMVHYDTVFPDGEAGRRPFRIEAGRATGPGVADAKGGVVMILQALELLRTRNGNDHTPITVLFNPDEEIGSPGSAPLIAELARRHAVVLSFEPSPQNGVIDATKGIAFLSLAVRGRAAHAGADPASGRNAAVELAHQIVALQNLGDPARGTTVNWTVLRSGERPNVIPAEATATADLRYSDPLELERVRQQGERTISRRHIPDTTASLTLTPRRPPFPPNPATQALVLRAQAIFRELQLPLPAIAMGFGTDAGHAFQSGSSCPAVLEGLGVVGGDLHSPAEWMDLGSLPARLYLVVRLLETLPSSGCGPS
ncbi:M20/M25/M40 family metallo-hydrolase [Synechococcus sp. CBW1002]|uniref:glutamate carboxypeptidase n=1 Tax=Synechococcus sp. CBW1002 TaxID=1353134 RepID=UPI0018CE4C04|nr:glutamate carboxypeptidase [Synechococcus sp. CBW1002]QPN59321.1 M20/M25/M40 family metallo-hydrolase [Synechococcus sp. CBW1002]